MKKDIDGYYIAASIRLVRQTHKGTILLVEGETDERALERFVDQNHCTIEIGFGKPNVLEALDLLEDEGFSGLVAIIDSDFDRIVGKTYQLDNVCITDLHDLDLTIFYTNAFDRYVSEHADRKLFESSFGSDCKALREKIIQASLPLAYCRLVSEKKKLSLFFKNLDYEEFVSRRDLSTDEKIMFRSLIDRSNTTCTLDSLDSLLRYEKAKNWTAVELVSGHDASAVLGIALRALIATRREAQTWASEVEAGLRLAFDWKALAETKLCKRLLEWETQNKPYKIFENTSVS